MTRALGYTSNLNKTFGKIVALKDLSFTIPRGITGFIGPNGAGKTTTINILTGLVKPDSGEATLFNLDVWERSFEVRKKLGVLLEEVDFPTNITGYRFLKHVARIYGVKDVDEYLISIAKEIEFEWGLKHEIGTYSAGMLKKLAILTALINPEMELLILDEPSANLDVGSRLKLIELIKRLYDEKSVNIFISSHILPELEEICTYIILINRGRKIFEGPWEEIIRTIKVNEYYISSSDVDRLLEHISSVDRVKNVVKYRGKLLISTDDPNRVLKKLVELSDEIGITILEFKPKEDVFSLLFRRFIYEEAN